MSFTPGPFFVQVQDGFEVAVNDNQSAQRIELLVGDKVTLYIDKTSGIIHVAQMNGGPNSVGLASSDGVHAQVTSD